MLGRGRLLLAVALREAVAVLQPAQEVQNQRVGNRSSIVVFGSALERVECN